MTRCQKNSIHILFETEEFFWKKGDSDLNTTLTTLANREEIYIDSLFFNYNGATFQCSNYDGPVSYIVDIIRDIKPVEDENLLQINMSCDRNFAFAGFANLSDILDILGGTPSHGEVSEFHCDFEGNSLTSEQCDNIGAVMEQIEKNEFLNFLKNEFQKISKN